VEAVRQGVAPGGVFGLQGEQLGDGIVPALRAGSPVGWTSIAPHGRRLLSLAAGAVAGLAFGVGQRRWAGGLAALGDSVAPLRNAMQ
jgi:hypothetical protein